MNQQVNQQDMLNRLILVAFIFLILVPSASATNYASGKTPTYGGSWVQVPASPALAVDGDFSTADADGGGLQGRISGVGSTANVTVDMGSLIYIANLSLKYTFDFNTGVNARVQTSIDGSSYATLETESYGAECGAGLFSDTKEVIVNSMIRYVRLSYESTTACIFTAQTFEIQAFGSPWANESYIYRTPVSMINGVRPYQFSLNITNSTGTNNATDIFTQGKCLTANCSDIKFYLNNITELPHWIEINASTGIRGKLWVNVTANGTVSMYYGNNTISARNNTKGGKDTFTQYNESNPTADSIAFGQNQAIRANVSFTADSQQIGWYSAILGAPKMLIAINTALTPDESYYSTTGGYSALSGGQNIPTGYHTIEIIRNANTNIITTYNDANAQTHIAETTNSLYARTLNSPSLNWMFVRNYTSPEPTWATWGTEQPLYSNNRTQNTNLSLSQLQGKYTRFYYNGTTPKWEIDGVNQTGSYGIDYIDVQAAGTKIITANSSISWTYTAVTYTLELTSPTNGSTGGTTTPTLLAREWPSQPPYTYEVSTDNQFINIIVTGSGTATDETISSGAISLNPSTKYYWRFKNGTGTYTTYFEYTTASPPITPGHLNITVFDEQNWSSRIMIFSAQIYNSTYTTNRSTTTGWVNFSSSEVASGEYLVRIVPNASFASRSTLVTSPANVTMYIPSTANTINTVAFYLLDYTGFFPWQDSVFTISKNNSVMHSSYFDADAKVAAYLIQGDSYKLTVTHGSSIQEWGNYIPISSGNVEVTLIDIGVNTTEYVPFNYNITNGANNITLHWSDSGTLNSLNFSIYKGAAKTLVHQLTTSVSHGMSEYLVTNTSDIYYVYFTANTTTGTYPYSYTVDYRAGTRRSDDGIGYIWNYGSFTAPEWLYTAFSMLILILMGAGFGAIHSPFGSVVTGIFALIFAERGWMTQTTAGIGFFGGLVVFLVLYYMQDKEKKP